ncbi:MAG: secondary thiamine-phosphate synthase enzyme YjbQ [Candidatus Paceibacterota bacterium]|jgi:secondary thiamine-phosphate synthase enzyme
MKTFNKTIKKETNGEFDFIDLTGEVEEIVKEGNIKNGLVNIQTLHTTCPVFLNENEPLLLEDFKSHLRKMAPKEADYNHNDFTRRTVNMCENECKNGHSHCLAINFPSSLALNLIEGKLQLGQWQRIFLVELDVARPRQIQVQVLGE